jgi:hypothetical protein
MNSNWQNDVASRLLAAQTPGDVREIIELAALHYGSKAIPVGRSNNIGTIRMASDPGLALVERITNGIDSLLELGIGLNPAEAHAAVSPEAAARLLYGVPVGGLGDMTETERRALAENLVVTMHESGDAKRPTIRVQDHGIGQHPEDFSKTLLSLNESNKVGKPYTMGTYGQGGSVTFGFSELTIIISRRHPDLLDGRDDVVGWTVVYEEETDPTKNVLPRYVWLVQPDGSTFTLPVSSFSDLPNGTRITHIEYDVQSLRGPYTTQMWQFLHATLFDPILPFLLGGDRASDPKKSGGDPGDRVIIGNATRLANVDRARGDIDLAATDTHMLDLGEDYGNVEVTWWALTRPEGSTTKSGPAEGYVQANNAICLTLHGQRQDAEARSWIKDKAMMPFLYKNMVVHIAANGLTPIGRRELFASTRERATQSELRRIIYDRVAELMRTDDDLKTLNNVEKERLLKSSTAATNEKIRKRLGKFIKSKLKGTSVAGSKQTGPGKGGDPAAGGTEDGAKWGNPRGKSTPGAGRSIDDSHLPNVPTYLRFDAKRVRVAQGATGFVWVEVDAKNGFLPQHDDALTIAFSGDGAESLKIQSRSRLLGGRSRWAVHAAPTAPVGAASLEVSLAVAGPPLKASIPVEIVEPPEPHKEGNGGQDEDTGPDVQWITKDGWPDDVNAHTVGYVTEDAESTIIWVNRDFHLLDRALASRGLTGEQIQTRADRYQFPVACGLWLQHHDLKTANPKPDDKYLMAELERLAEAVLVAMDPDVELAGTNAEE